MRLWSLHPQYLDTKGLVALWREALLAQAVLAGKTRGYTRHPQLQRFRAQARPLDSIAGYLWAVHWEAAGRGYRFSAEKIAASGNQGDDDGSAGLTVTRGQLDFEWQHLSRKLAVRDPQRQRQQEGIGKVQAHPLFRVVRGGIAPWEKIGDDG